MLPRWKLSSETCVCEGEMRMATMTNLIHLLSMKSVIVKAFRVVAMRTKVTFRASSILLLS